MSVMFILLIMAAVPFIPEGETQSIKQTNKQTTKTTEKKLLHGNINLGFELNWGIIFFMALLINNKPAIKYRIEYHLV